MSSETLQNIIAIVALLQVVGTAVVIYLLSVISLANKKIEELKSMDLAEIKKDLKDIQNRTVTQGTDIAVIKEQLSR